MSHATRLYTFTTTSLLFVVLSATPVDAALTVTIGPTAVSVAGATPSSRIAVCGYTHTYINEAETFTPQASIVTTAADGTASVHVVQPAFRSIWLVADLTDGSYVVATPPRYAPRQMSRQPVAVGKAPAITISKQYVYLCVIRSPLGAWTGTAIDGRPTDSDQLSNATVSVSLSGLAAVDDTPAAPSLFLSGDIVFTIDPAWLQYAVVRIP